MRITNTLTAGTEYRPQCKFALAPAILKEYVDQDGVRMYETKNGKHFIANVYDWNFKVVPQKVIRDRKYKGENPGQPIRK